MGESPALTLKTLDPILTGLVREHQEKVIGWMQDEPGCWGFLAGQAVASCRRELGRSLEELERRLVWDRLWWLLETIKKEVSGNQPA
jgi:hypothetical protein